MSNNRQSQLMRFINDTPLPAGRNLTSAAQHVYEQGQALLSTYRGNTEVLVEALKIFYQTNSMPYTCAGIAAVLGKAAFLYDDKYDTATINEALRYAENAEQLAPDNPELSLTRANIYINMQRLDDAGALLDRLRPRLGDTYDFLAVEMYYWRQRKDPAQVLKVFNKALPVASEPQKRYQHEALASHYMEMKDYPRGIEAYKGVLKFSPENPWAWHNISVMLYRQKHYREAAKYNRQALKLMNFGAATKMTELIGKNLTWWDRLLLRFNSSV